MSELSPFEHWSLAEPDGAPPPRVAWFYQTPLCFVGSWEPLSFRKRAGYAWVDEEEAYRQEFSDAALERYKELGATSISIPFAKGFGQEATQGELEHERDVIRRAHKIGLRVATYIRVDALVPETIRPHEPDVDSWFMRGMHGKISSYNRQQTFRRRICYSNPGAVAYLEAQLRYAVETLDADQLHLDGFATAATPETTCRCPRCIDSYRRWIHRRYPSADALNETFGLVDVSGITPPECERDEFFPSTIISPDIRAWLRFHWDREAAFTRHVRRFVHQLNSDVAITTNPWSLGMYKNMNAPLRHFSRALRLLPWFDGVWSEDHFHLRFEKGQVISRALTYKAVRETATPLCGYHWTDRPGAMAASIAMNIAANAGHISCLGFTFRFLPHVELCAPVKQHLARWTSKQWKVLGNTKPIGDIGLLRHHETLAWNSGRPWHAIEVCQRTLTGLRIPWRLIDGVESPAMLAVRTLIAADVECLSDGELAKLRAWVEAGGRLLVTRRTGRYDLDRRCRPVHPILNWTPSWKGHAASGPREWFSWISEDATPEEFAKPSEPIGGLHDPEIVELGLGKVGWLPTLPAEDANVAAFLARLHGLFTPQVHGPPQLVAEFNRSSDGRTLVHLIRADEGTAPIDAVVQLENRVEAKSVTLLSPDSNPPSLQIESNTIRLTRLDRYAVLCLELK